MRDIPVGNGSLLVIFDDKYEIRDIYFPLLMKLKTFGRND